MNEQFKEEFKKLNAEEIKDIVNRCGEHNVFVNCNDECFIKYMDNDEYGFWTIQWGMQKVQYMGMNFGCGFFKNSIKLTPFRLEFEVTNEPTNAYVKPRNKKSLEEYLQLYINRKCPHYKQAIMEETEKFIKMLDVPNNLENDDELSK